MLDKYGHIDVKLLEFTQLIFRQNQMSEYDLDVMDEDVICGDAPNMVTSNHVLYKVLLNLLIYLL